MDKIKYRITRQFMIFSRYAEAICLMLLSRTGCCRSHLLCRSALATGCRDLVPGLLFTFVVVTIIPDHISVLGMNISIPPDMAAAAIFLSYLYGSELFGEFSVNSAHFLSCPYGSEPVTIGKNTVINFLSCPYGSELVR